MTEDKRKYFEEMMEVANLYHRLKKYCECCPICCDYPCAGVMAGGMCDMMPCSCDDDLSEDIDDD